MPSRPRWIRWPPAILALAVLPAAAEEPRSPPPATSTLFSLGPAAIAILTLPPADRTDRSLPVAILLPDEDGPGPRSMPYAERLLENGVALLEPDFVAGPDGSPQPSPAAQMRLVLDAVAGDARLDPRRVAVLGLGAGARTALLGLAEGAPSALVLLYPGCDAVLARAARAAPAATRVLLLHGGADAANDTAACAMLARAFPEARAVAHRVLSGASYGWDAYSLVRPGGGTRLPHPAGIGRAWSWPDPVQTEVAADRVLGFVLAALERR